MTAPTIEQIFILMQQQLQIAADSFRNVGLAIDADDCEEILAKSKTATPSANTLPLDEVPNDMEFILKSTPYRRGYSVVIFKGNYAVGQGYESTPAEALRAAIAKVKP